MCVGFVALSLGREGGARGCGFSLSAFRLSPTPYSHKAGFISPPSRLDYQWLLFLVTKWIKPQTEVQRDWVSRLQKIAQHVQKAGRGSRESENTLRGIFY